MVYCIKANPFIDNHDNYFPIISICDTKCKNAACVSESVSSDEIIYTINTLHKN